jgi:excisionase family DNA binding protein
METEYLTKKELLAYLKVSRTIVEKLMRQGLPHIKLDRRVLFRRSDVDAFLESRQVRKGGKGA